MSRVGVATTLAGFVVGLGAVFGGAWALGAAIGPGGADERADAARGAAHGAAHDNGAARPAGEPGLPGGLAVAQDGHRLVLADAVLPPGTRQLSFTVEGPDGRPVTAYDVAHEKELHLVVVRRDAGGFQHVHPTLDRSTGRWSAPVDLEPGAWRVLADFVPAGGQRLTLGSDLLVPGRVPAPPPAEETRVTRVGGYAVEVEGHLEAGSLSPLELRVTRGGEPADLQAYLGASGHLIALREGDLAHLHVHPDGDVGAPDGEITFAAEVPSPGRHHLYLDFRHRGVVRTAHLVLDAH